MVLDHFYDVRVVHDAMRQRDLLDPQRFEVMDFGRHSGDAALSISMEPYRCAVDLKVVDAFGDDLPRARVRLGDHDLGTRRGVLDLGPNGAVVQPEEGDGFHAVFSSPEWRSTTATRFRAGGPVSLRPSGIPSERNGALRRVRAAAACEQSPTEPAGAHRRKFPHAARHLEGRHALLLAPLFHRFPRAPRARRVQRRRPGVDVAAACVEINPCVRGAIATPSSRRRVDGVEDDAMIQHERAVKF